MFADQKIMTLKDRILDCNSPLKVWKARFHKMTYFLKLIFRDNLTLKDKTISMLLLLWHNKRIYLCFYVRDPIFVQVNVFDLT